MVDTPRTLAYLLGTSFVDGQPVGSITPQDIRDLIVSLQTGIPNIKGHGAKVDGVTDDQVAIDATITEAAGGFTYFMSGTALTAAITMLNNSKLDGRGIILKPSVNTMTLITIPGDLSLQSSDYQLIRDFRLFCSGKTGITAIKTTSAGVASLIIENIISWNCDTVDFDLQWSQFVRTYNLRASLGGGVGMQILNKAVDGGANSHDHYGFHAIQKEVGVFVNGANYIPLHSINFYNPQILENTVCGMAFFDAGAVIYGGAPEFNGTGAATKVIDGKTVKRCSMHLDSSNVRAEDYHISEATVNPCFILENNSILTLSNASGYGNTAGVLVSADATSGVNLQGSFSALGVVQNVISWPDAYFLHETAQMVAYGEPVLKIDPTLNNAPFAEQAPKLLNSAVSPPLSNSWVEDFDLGLCREVQFDTVVGNENDGNTRTANFTGVASQDTLLTLLVKSDIDCEIGINLHDGAAFHAFKATDVFLKSGKVTRIVVARRAIAGGSWKIHFYPLDTSGPTIKFANIQVVQGATYAPATSQLIASVVRHGLFWPGPSRASTTELNDVASTVNTVGKFTGKQVWNNVAQRPTWSIGNEPWHVWKDGSNGTLYSPV